MGLKDSNRVAACGNACRLGLTFPRAWKRLVAFFWKPPKKYPVPAVAILQLELCAPPLCVAGDLSTRVQQVRMPTTTVARPQKDWIEPKALTIDRIVSSSIVGTNHLTVTEAPALEMQDRGDLVEAVRQNGIHTASQQLLRLHREENRPHSRTTQSPHLSVTSLLFIFAVKPDAVHPAGACGDRATGVKESVQ